MAIKVGIAPDSWGVWFPEHEKQTPWYRCMDEMKVAGYDGVELGPWGYFPNKNPMLKNALGARGLSLVATKRSISSCCPRCIPIWRPGNRSWIPT